MSCFFSLVVWHFFLAAQQCKDDNLSKEQSNGRRNGGDARATMTIIAMMMVITLQ
jgi:hypothetical protein